jgi:hypothetical protein
MLTDEGYNTDPEPEPESEPANVPIVDGNNVFADRLCLTTTQNRAQNNAVVLSCKKIGLQGI